MASSSGKSSAVTASAPEPRFIIASPCWSPIKLSCHRAAKTHKSARSARILSLIDCFRILVIVSLYVSSIPDGRSSRALRISVLDAAVATMSMWSLAMRNLQHSRVWPAKVSQHTTPRFPYIPSAFLMIFAAISLRRVKSGLSSLDSSLLSSIRPSTNFVMSSSVALISTFGDSQNRL